MPPGTEATHNVQKEKNNDGRRPPSLSVSGVPRFLKRKERKEGNGERKESMGKNPDAVAIHVVRGQQPERLGSLKSSCPHPVQRQPRERTCRIPPPIAGFPGWQLYSHKHTVIPKDPEMHHSLDVIPKDPRTKHRGLTSSAWLGKVSLNKQK